MATVQNKKKPVAKSRPSGLLTWIAVGAVVAVLAAFVYPLNLYAFVVVEDTNGNFAVATDFVSKNVSG